MARLYLGRQQGAESFHLINHLPSRVAKALSADAAVAAFAVAVTLTITCIVTMNETKACQEEYKAVQNSLVAYIAYNHLSTVHASVGTSDMTTPVRLYTSDATTTNPSFARNSQTRWMYAWDSKGKITQILPSTGGPYVTPGCTMSPP